MSSWIFNSRTKVFLIACWLRDYFTTVLFLKGKANCFGQSVSSFTWVFWLLAFLFLSFVAFSGVLHTYGGKLYILNRSPEKKRRMSVSLVVLSIWAEVSVSNE